MHIRLWYRFRFHFDVFGPGRGSPVSRGDRPSTVDAIMLIGNGHLCCSVIYMFNCNCIHVCAGFFLYCSLACDGPDKPDGMMAPTVDPRRSKFFVLNLGI